MKETFFFARRMVISMNRKLTLKWLAEVQPSISSLPDSVPNRKIYQEVDGPNHRSGMISTALVSWRVSLSTHVAMMVSCNS